MQRCWVNFQCQGVLLVWIIVGQGSIVLAIGADGGRLDIFLSSAIPLLSPSLWEMASYRLKYCLFLSVQSQICALVASVLYTKISNKFFSNTNPDQHQKSSAADH